MTVPPISIRTLLRGPPLAVGLLILGLLAVSALIANTQRAMVTVSQRHFDSNQAAIELRDSSNQLTMMARLYVDTGDPRYVGYYNDILAIRNGQAPRPPEYRGAYWDLVMADRQPHPSGGQVQSFVDSLEALKFSADEFDLLREAQKQSDDLVNLEREAFAAIDGRFLDANGILTREGLPDSVYARSLLNGSRYLVAKAGVMEPIAEFGVRVMQRTGEMNSQLAAKRAFQIALALSLVGLTLIIVLGADRKNMKTSLLESEARYRVIFDVVDDLVYSIEADGTFSSLSPSFERMTGWLPEDWIGKPFAPLSHPDDLPRMQELFARLVSGEVLPAIETRLVMKSGTYLDTEFKSVAVGHGESFRIFGVLRDVTERKRMEMKVLKLNQDLEVKVQERTAQLLEAQDELVRKERLSMLGQVAGSVGHELRNPLGVMSNAVYFLQTVLSDADDVTKEYLEIIANEITAADRIVGDLLDSVRIKPPRPETVSVARLIEQSLVKCTIPASVAVQLDIPESLQPLLVDSMQIVQVFRNIVSNCVEAMPAVGTLKIQAAAGTGSGNVTVRIADTGIGMTPKQLAALFQPLVTTKARGIGLGLVVVKNLTEANGGSIAVESAPGSGSTFAVTLPVSGAELEREGSGP